jgi:hypothetical protein
MFIFLCSGCPIVATGSISKAGVSPHLVANIAGIYFLQIALIESFLTLLRVVTRFPVSNGVSCVI